MQLNSIIFPAPNPSYTAFSLPSLIWIPRSRFFSLKTIIKSLKTSSFSETYLQTRKNTEDENIAQQSTFYCIDIASYFHMTYCILFDSL